MIIEYWLKNLLISFDIFTIGERKVGVVRKAMLSDLDKVVEIHKQEFSDHFLGIFSQSLIRKFYLCFLNNSCIFLVSEERTVVNGFILGGLSSELEQSKADFLKNNKMHYMFEILLNPRVYIKALQRFPLLLKVKKENKAVLDKEPVRLLSIAVADSAKGRGVARELINNFEAEVNCVEYGLSVKLDNKRAIDFYSKNGFIIDKKTGESLYLLKPIIR